MSGAQGPSIEPCITSDGVFVEGEEAREKDLAMFSARPGTELQK